MDDKNMLKLMDKAVHELSRTNPVAAELKKSTHRKGAQNHDLVLGVAFAAMYELLNKYAEFFEVERIENETEISDRSESKSDT